MERKLHQEPVFDLDLLRQNLDLWKQNGVRTIIIEWSTGIGPTVFYYPADQRRVGVKWTAAVEVFNYNEIYADFIEKTLVPRIAETIASRQMESSVRCVDLQPIQVQRQRRHDIEHFQEAAATC